MAQNDKKSVCRAPYLRNHTSYEMPVSLRISGTVRHMIVVFDTHV